MNPGGANGWGKRGSGGQGESRGGTERRKGWVKGRQKDKEGTLRPVSRGQG